MHTPQFLPFFCYNLPSSTHLLPAAAAIGCSNYRDPNKEPTENDPTAAPHLKGGGERKAGGVTAAKALRTQPTQQQPLPTINGTLHATLPVLPEQFPLKQTSSTQDETRGPAGGFFKEQTRPSSHNTAGSKRVPTPPLPNPPPQETQEHPPQ
jgi:hypothetical protein